MSDANDWNSKVIDEFRANGGKVGNYFEGATMLLLHHKGAKSGTERVSPLVYLPAGDNLVVFASKGGAPTNPDWYHNLLAHPDVTIEVGSDTVPVTAREAHGDERDTLWEAVKAYRAGFADYETKTTRVIPAIVLEPRATGA
jgi:deazaflavin-dependent oxidoreductase (nitroreductase family)